MDKTDVKCFFGGLSISLSVIILRRLLGIEVLSLDYFALWTFAFLFVGGILSVSQAVNDN